MCQNSIISLRRNSLKKLNFFREFFSSNFFEILRRNMNFWRNVSGLVATKFPLIFTKSAFQVSKGKWKCFQSCFPNMNELRINSDKIGKQLEEDSSFAWMIFCHLFRLAETKETAAKQLHLLKKWFSEEGMQYISGRTPSPSFFHLFSILKKCWFFG